MKRRIGFSTGAPVYIIFVKPREAHNDNYSAKKTYPILQSQKK